MKQLLIIFVRGYQRFLSPDQGVLRFLYGSTHQYCMMYPSCSEYMLQSLEKYGSIKGVFRGTKRVFRCHPYQKTFVDLP
jgi:putative membrane protein insertion efficiency factor